MHHFRYVRGRLYCEGVSVESLAKQHGSPLYVYSAKTLTDNFNRLHTACATGSPDLFRHEIQLQPRRHAHAGGSGRRL